MALDMMPGNIPATMGMNSLSPTQISDKRDEYLRILVAAGVLAKNDIAIMQKKYETAEGVIQNFKAKKLLTDEVLTRAYAELNHVRYTELADADDKITQTTPDKVVNKYKILPYKIENRILRVAVANPERLVQGDIAVIDDIEKRTGLKVDIDYTTDNAIENFKNRKQVSTQPQGNYPRIDLTLKKIPYSVINQIPEEMARAYKVVIFDVGDNNGVKLAAVDYNDKKVSELIEFIAKNNNIGVEKYLTDNAGITAALKYYQQDETSEMINQPLRPADKPVDNAVDIENTDNQTPVGNISPENGQSPAISNSTPTEQPVQWTPPSPATQKIQEADDDKIEEFNKIVTVDPTTNETDLDQFIVGELKQPSDLKQVISTGNIPKIVGSIVKLSSIMRASDIHIESRVDNVIVRYRIDGKLEDVAVVPPELRAALNAKIKILSKLKIDETRIPQDGRYGVIVGEHEIDLRVSTMPTVFGEKIVLRLLDKDAGLFDLDSLGIVGINYDRIIKAIDKPFGIVMSTGPTGAGKSTSLYAALNRLNKPETNIVTLEDPVEYEISGINQVQVKPQIGFTFAEGLRAVLRQDPNIIMVGEVRDAETANLVTHAALTGHLVLTTLHTNDSSGAIPRLVNMGVEPFLIASAINAVIAQRLVRRLCEKCRQEIELPEKEANEVKIVLDKAGYKGEIKFYQPGKCAECHDTGYKGRVGIYEVLEVDNEIEDLIIANATASQIMEAGLRKGMQTMRADGFIKAVQGVTTVNEVLQATVL